MEKNNGVVKELKQESTLCPSLARTVSVCLVSQCKSSFIAFPFSHKDILVWTVGHRSAEGLTFSLRQCYSWETFSCFFCSVYFDEHLLKLNRR